jgi:hypothetical protein
MSGAAQDKQNLARSGLSSPQLGHRMPPRYPSDQEPTNVVGCHRAKSLAALEWSTAGLQHRHAIRYRAGRILTNEALLDSYNAQRRPVGRFLVRFTDRAFSVAISTNSLARTIRTPRVTLEILPW